MSQNVAKKQLSAKQVQTITAILQHPTNEAAMAAVGITSRTFYRWLKDEAFLLALREAESKAIDRAVRQLIALQNDALAFIRETINDDAAGTRARLAACRLWLDCLIRLRDVRLDERITDLERAVFSENV